MVEEAPQTPETIASGAIEIHRDPSFTRVTADHVIAVDRGVDMEFALLASGPDVVALREQILEDSLGQTVTMKKSYTELGRLRLSHPTALTTAMIIIERGLQADRIDVPQFLAAIDSLVEKWSRDEAEEEADEEGA